MNAFVIENLYQLEAEDTIDQARDMLSFILDGLLPRVYSLSNESTSGLSFLLADVENLLDTAHYFLDTSKNRPIERLTSLSEAQDKIRMVTHGLHGESQLEGDLKDSTVSTLTDVQTLLKRNPRHTRQSIPHTRQSIPGASIDQPRIWRTSL